MDVNQGDSILGNISYPQDIIKITTFLTDFKTKQQQQTPKYIKIIVSCLQSLFCTKTFSFKEQDQRSQEKNRLSQTHRSRRSCRVG